MTTVLRDISPDFPFIDELDDFDRMAQFSNTDRVEFEKESDGDKSKFVMHQITGDDDDRGCWAGHEGMRVKTSFSTNSESTANAVAEYLNETLRNLQHHATLSIYVDNDQVNYYLGYV